MLAGLLLMITAIFCYGTMKDPAVSVLWTIFYRLLVPVALFFMTSTVELPETKPWMHQSLFLYAIHFIIVRLMNKGMAIILGKLAVDTAFVAERMPAFAAGIYLMIPVVTVVCSYLAALFLSRRIPPLWKILSGGRNL